MSAYCLLTSIVMIGRIASNGAWISHQKEEDDETHETDYGSGNNE